MYFCGWRYLGMAGGHANSCVMGILNVFVNLGDQCGSKYLSVFHPGLYVDRACFVYLVIYLETLLLSCFKYTSICLYILYLLSCCLYTWCYGYASMCF